MLMQKTTKIVQYCVCMFSYYTLHFPSFSHSMEVVNNIVKIDWGYNIVFCWYFILKAQCTPFLGNLNYELYSSCLHCGNILSKLIMVRTNPCSINNDYVC